MQHLDSQELIVYVCDYIENNRMGNTHKVSHDDETSSEIIKQK